VTGNGTVRGKIDTPALRTSFDEAKVSIQCLYVGCVPVTDSTSKEDLKRIIEKKCNSAREDWTKVTMEISKSAIVVRDYKNPVIIPVDCPSDCLKFYGVYTPNNKFGSMHVHKSPSDALVHVFYCEPSADHWCMNIHAVCKPAHLDDKGTIRKSLKKLFTGSKKT